MRRNNYDCTMRSASRVCDIRLRQVDIIDMIEGNQILYEVFVGRYVCISLTIPLIKNLLSNTEFQKMMRKYEAVVETTTTVVVAKRQRHGVEVVSMPGAGGTATLNEANL